MHPYAPDPHDDPNPPAPLPAPSPGDVAQEIDAARTDELVVADAGPTVAVAGAPSDNTTLTSVLAGLADEGYSGHFVALEGGDLRCDHCGVESPASSFPVHARRRLEGASDPDDMVSVVAGRCPNCGDAGVLVLGFGPSASAADADVSLAIAHLDPARPEPAAGRASMSWEDAEHANGLIGVTLPDVYSANEFLMAVRRLAASERLQLRDAVMVVKQDDGSVMARETIDPQPGRSAVNGALWAGLLGLLFGGPVGWIAGLGIGAGVGAAVAKVVDIGVPDEWVDWFRHAAPPGTSTVVLLVDELDADAFRHEVERFEGAELLHTTINTRALLELRAFER